MVNWRVLGKINDTFEVTHGHARKINGIGGVATLHDVLHDLDAV